MKKLIIIIIFFGIGCNQQESPENWVAKYNDSYLLKRDILSVIPKGLSEDDSLLFVNQYIEKWAKDRVLMHTVNDFLNEEEIVRIQTQVESYRENLMESAIEEKFMQDISDEVSEEELKDYYEKFPETFILKDDIITLKLLEVPEDSANRYKRMLRNQEYEDLQARLEFNQYRFDFTKDNWVELDKLLATDVLPERIKNQNIMVRNQIFSATDNNRAFIIQIDGIGKKGEPAPYSYIKPTIKSVVLNKRKLNLLSEKKHELYEKALENHEIKKK